MIEAASFGHAPKSKPSKDVDSKYSNDDRTGECLASPIKSQTVCIPPVVGLRLYRHDALAVRAPTGRKNAAREVERGAAAAWSEDSARHLRWLVANTDAAWTAVLLVTLPAGRYQDGKGVRKALARLLDRVRKKWGKTAYLWVREWTENGTPHYHLLLTVPSVYTRKSKRKSGRWAKIDEPKQDWLRAAWRAAASRIATWPVGEEPVCSWEVVEDPIAAARYIGFYSAKKRQKTPPEWAENYGRWWGASYGLEPVGREWLPGNEAEIIARLGPGYTDCRSGLYRQLHGAAAMLRGREDHSPYPPRDEVTGVTPFFGRALPGQKRTASEVRPKGMSYAGWYRDPRGSVSVRRARAVARKWSDTPPLSRCIAWRAEGEAQKGWLPPWVVRRGVHPRVWVAMCDARVCRRADARSLRSLIQ